MTLTFELPFGLARRLAMRPIALARRDAALVARVERAYCRAHDIEDRNVRARNAARRFLAGLGYEVK